MSNLLEIRNLNFPPGKTLYYFSCCMLTENKMNFYLQKFFNRNKYQITTGGSKNYEINIYKTHFFVKIQLYSFFQNHSIIQRRCFYTLWNNLSSPSKYALFSAITLSLESYLFPASSFLTNFGGQFCRIWFILKQLEVQFLQFCYRCDQLVAWCW